MEDLFGIYSEHISRIEDMYKIIELIRSDIYKKSWMNVRAYYLGSEETESKLHSSCFNKDDYSNIDGTIKLDAQKYIIKTSRELFHIEYSIPLFMAAAIMGDDELLIELKKRYGNSLLVANEPYISVKVTNNNLKALYTDLFEFDTTSLFTYILWPVYEDGIADKNVIDIIVKEYDNDTKQQKSLIREKLVKAIRNLIYRDWIDDAVIMLKEKMPDIYKDIVKDVYIKKNEDCMHISYIVMEDAIDCLMSEHKQKIEERKDSDSEKNSCHMLSQAEFKRTKWQLEKQFVYRLCYSTWKYFYKKGDYLFKDEPWENNERISAVLCKRNTSFKKNNRQNRYELFKKIIEKNGHNMEDVQLVSILNIMWNEILENKGEHHFFEDDIYETTIDEYEMYEKYIKSRLKALDGKVDNIKNSFIELYVMDKSPIDEKFITMFYFYKNSITPEKDIVINIQDYMEMGCKLGKINLEELVCSGDWITVFEDKRIDYICKIWKDSRVLISKPKNLYEYQKKILEECNESLLLKAVKAGFFPPEVYKKALEYANANNLKEVIPLITMLTYRSEE